jgi:hypothetical protein
MSESFLSIMGLLRNMPVGNPSQTVSRPTWDHCVTIPQETLRQQFPVRHGTTVHHTHRKPSPAVSCPAKDQCVTCQ